MSRLEQETRETPINGSSAHTINETDTEGLNLNETAPLPPSAVTPIEQRVEYLERELRASLKRETLLREELRAALKREGEALRREELLLEALRTARGSEKVPPEDTEELLKAEVQWEDAALEAEEEWEDSSHEKTIRIRLQNNITGEKP